MLETDEMKRRDWWSISASLSTVKIGKVLVAVRNMIETVFDPRDLRHYLGPKWAPIWALNGLPFAP